MMPFDFQDADLAALNAALSGLQGTRSYDFACDLLLQGWNAEGGFSRPLSDKQMFWVKKLAQPKQAKPAVAIGDCSGVVALMKGAKKKFPKVKLALPDGKPIMLSIAGPASKYAGSINVTDGGKFGANIWYGTVSPAGAWNMSGKVDDATATALGALLSAFAADPAAVASAYGQATHNCCFCQADLTDDRSKKVGYGPICAAKFNLPWGAK